MKIIIGVPAFNEEKNIGSLIVNLKKKYDHVLVCDDGSSDTTANIASEMGAIVVKHSKIKAMDLQLRLFLMNRKKLIVIF